MTCCSLLHRGDDFVHGIYYSAINTELDCVTEAGIVCDPLSHSLIQAPSLLDVPSFLEAIKTRLKLSLLPNRIVNGPQILRVPTQ